MPFILLIDLVFLCACSDLFWCSRWLPAFSSKRVPVHVFLLRGSSDPFRLALPFLTFPVEHVWLFSSLPSQVASRGLSLIFLKSFARQVENLFYNLAKEASGIAYLS
jgi:hypothetical protein